VQEVEIKLQVPRPRLAAVLAAVERGRCASTRLHAYFFDTPECGVRAAGYVLRQRREGRRWVQAIKGPGDGLLARVEHEVDCGAAAARPALDLALHAATPAGRALIEGLARQRGALAPVFEIDVRRRCRLVRHQGATVDLALDEGWIRCGTAREPVCELELELKTGSIDALIALASHWIERHGLWFDIRTKSERGYLLAEGLSARPAAMAEVPRLSAHDSVAGMLRSCTRAALAQLLPNTSALAAGGGGAEHVHQARVALRRLLSLWREFGAWGDGLDAHWAEAASSLFDLLGAARDRDVLEQLWLPRLREAGAPPIALAPPADGPSPAEACRDPAASVAMLEWLHYAHGEPAAANGHALDPAYQRLGRLHRRLRRAGHAFASLAADERHRARRQLKRLRYCADALSSLFPKDDWANYLQRLKTAQEALGALQDWSVAHAHFATRPDADAGVWFARGWLAAQHAVCVDDAARSLVAIGKRPRFLR
jgi:inorganic triphosphatase YgiF